MGSDPSLQAAGADGIRVDAYADNLLVLDIRTWQHLTGDNRVVALRAVRAAIDAELSRDA